MAMHSHLLWPRRLSLILTHLPYLLQRTRFISHNFKLRSHSTTPLLSLSFHRMVVYLKVRLLLFHNIITATLPNIKIGTTNLSLWLVPLHSKSLYPAGNGLECIVCPFISYHPSQTCPAFSSAGKPCLHQLTLHPPLTCLFFYSILELHFVALKLDFPRELSGFRGGVYSHESYLTSVPRFPNPLHAGTRAIRRTIIIFHSSSFPYIHLWRSLKFIHINAKRYYVNHISRRPAPNSRDYALQGSSSSSRFATDTSKFKAIALYFHPTYQRWHYVSNI